MKYKSLWGVGANIKESGEFFSYGYPTVKKASLFEPDRDCCSDMELEYHQLCIIYDKQCEVTKGLLLEKNKLEQQLKDCEEALGKYSNAYNWSYQQIIDDVSEVNGSLEAGACAREYFEKYRKDKK